MIVGFRKRKLGEGMPPELEKLCEKRRQARLQTLSNPTNVSIRKQYQTINKEVKKAVRKCKTDTLDDKINQMEKDFRHNNSHELFKNVRNLESKKPKPLNTIKDVNGSLKTNLKDVLQCWEDHFKIHLNTKFPHDQEAMDSIPQPTQPQTADHNITLDEIQSAIKRCKVRKAPGIDQISAEVIRSGGEPMVNMLHQNLL